MRFETYEGIDFFEGMPRRTQVIGPASVFVGAAYRASQLQSEDDVKKHLAVRARDVGGNAIVEFKCGRRRQRWLDRLFRRGPETWYGEGLIAYVQ
jgi:hypothetical protein